MKMWPILLIAMVIVSCTSPTDVSQQTAQYTSGTAIAKPYYLADREDGRRPRPPIGYSVLPAHRYFTTPDVRDWRDLEYKSSVGGWEFSWYGNSTYRTVVYTVYYQEVTVPNAYGGVVVRLHIISPDDPLVESYYYVKSIY